MYACGPLTWKARVGQPVRIYLQQLCTDTGCHMEDLPRAMDNRDIDGTLRGTTTPGQSRPGSNSNEEELHISQSSRSGASPLDGLASYPRHSFSGNGRRSYISAEMQLAYSTVHSFPQPIGPNQKMHQLSETISHNRKNTKETWTPRIHQGNNVIGYCIALRGSFLKVIQLALIKWVIKNEQSVCQLLA